jgi:hypothetical protein
MENAGMVVVFSSDSATGWAYRRPRKHPRLPTVSTPYVQFLLAAMAGWVNRSQQDVIEYLQTENRILREQLGDRRLRLSDAQRRLPSA